MKPPNLTTKIFLDSADPAETKYVLDNLTFLDGQTTNPTLAAKLHNSDKKISKKEALQFYKEKVQQIADLLPQASVSVEVYVDKNTTVEEMVEQAGEMYGWIPNAHIKLPITKEGIEAGLKLFQNDFRLNFTLVFTQVQAAAIFRAFETAEPGQIFISPFIGRIDDQGKNGMDLTKNILQMKKEWGSKVEVLTASVRNMDHFLSAINIGTDIITAPYNILVEWGKNGTPTPQGVQYEPQLKQIPYKELERAKSWQEFDLSHPLTDAGIERFANDWNAIIK